MDKENDDIYGDPLTQIVGDLDDGRRVFAIRGAAGTGKTTLIGRLIPELEKRRYQVLLMAPTGRAAKMIQTRTGREASTIHSVIYRINDRPVAGTAENGDLKWMFPLSDKRPARTVFVVDEASMVGEALHNEGILQFGTGSLLQDLITYSGVENPDSDNVLTFVGDPYQLPPVNERQEDPPALDERNLEGQTGCRVSVVELKEIHRQRRESGILAEATKLRAAISVHLFGNYSYEEHDDVRSVAEDEFERLYNPLESLNDKVVISYTNRRVWEFNCRIRKLLGKNSAMPESGERLLSLRNTVVGGPEGRDVRFMNGDMLQVLAIDSENLVRLDGFYRPKGKDETLHFEFTFCKMTVGWLYESGPDDAEAWVNVTPITSEEYRREPEFASLALYVAVTKLIRERYGLKDNKADNEKLSEYLKKSRLYHAPWVTYGYAITGHKSQGGEWKEVWVDYRYSQNRMTEVYFRWMYTVTTRAKKMLFAIAPPAIDDLMAALERGIERSSQSGAGTARRPDNLPLRTILVRYGYSLVSEERRPYQLHLALGRADDPFSGQDALDLNYNRKGEVSYVHLRSRTASDEFGAAMAGLKGRFISSLFPEESQTTAVRPDMSSVAQSQLPLYERLSAAAEKSGITVRSVKSLTDHQLRIELTSELGDGYVDFYVDGRGRVSEMGSETVGAATLRKLREGMSS